LVDQIEISHLSSLLIPIAGTDLQRSTIGRTGGDRRWGPAGACDIGAK